MKLDANKVQQLSTVLQALQDPNAWGHAEAVAMANEASKAAQHLVNLGVAPESLLNLNQLTEVTL